jgi:hypothetical protein
MKTMTTYFQNSVWIFIFLIFFQSCVIYEKRSVPLDWASTQERKAKVKTVDNQTYKFKRIKSDNGHFYGVKDVNGEIIKTPLQDDQLKKIQLQNKGDSTAVTIAMIIGTVVAILLVSYFIETGGGDWLRFSE